MAYKHRDWENNKSVLNAENINILGKAIENASIAAESAVTKVNQLEDTVTTNKTNIENNNEAILKAQTDINNNKNAITTANTNIFNNTTNINQITAEFEKLRDNPMNNDDSIYEFLSKTSECYDEVFNSICTYGEENPIKVNFENPLNNKIGVIPYDNNINIRIYLHLEGNTPEQDVITFKNYKLKISTEEIEGIDYNDPSLYDLSIYNNSVYYMVPRNNTYTTLYISIIKPDNIDVPGKTVRIMYDYIFNTTRFAKLLSFIPQIDLQAIKQTIINDSKEEIQDQITDTVSNVIASGSNNPENEVIDNNTIYYFKYNE